MRRLLALLCLPLMLNGCVAALVAGGAETGVTIAEGRSVGRKVDDNVIYSDITNQFMQADQGKLITDVTFNIRYARVMLTGTVKNQGDAEKAVALTWKAKGVQEVINELVVNPDAGFFDTANDALIKRNLESRLLITKGVWVINYSMDVQGGVAYMIGRVKDDAEMTRVMNIARSTKGVKRVVNHLQIDTGDNQSGTPAPASMGNNPNSDSMNTNPYKNSSYNSSSSSSGSYGGSSLVNTSPAYSTAPVGGVDAPGSVSSGDLPPPASH